MTFTNCWKPVQITHVIDDDRPDRTLCGVRTDGWEFGSEVEDSTDGAMFSCERCGKALEKLERKAKAAPFGQQQEEASRG